MPAKREKTLLEQAGDVAETRRNWVERLPKKMREQLLELFEARRAGTIKITFSQISELLCSNGVKVKAHNVQDAYNRIAH